MEKSTALLLQASGFADGDDQKARKIADRLYAFRQTLRVILTAAIDEDRMRASLEQMTDLLGLPHFSVSFLNTAKETFTPTP